MKDREPWKPQPFTEKVKEFSDEDLQKEILTRTTVLGRFGVSTPLHELIYLGVQAFGGEFDSEEDESGWLKITGASLEGAIEHFHGGLTFSNRDDHEEFTKTVSNLAVLSQEFHDRTNGAKPFPELQILNGSQIR